MIELGIAAQIVEAPPPAVVLDGLPIFGDLYTARCGACPVVVAWPDGELVAFWSIAWPADGRGVVSTAEPADVSRDGFINIDDVLALLAYFADADGR